MNGNVHCPYEGEELATQSDNPTLSNSRKYIDVQQVNYSNNVNPFLYFC